MDDQPTPTQQNPSPLEPPNTPPSAPISTQPLPANPMPPAGKPRNRKLFIILVLLLIAGITAAAAFLVSRQNNKTSSSSGTDKQTVFKKITSNIWCTDKLDDVHPDYTESSYLADGKYSEQLFTDYNTDPETGSWNLEQAPDKTWFIVRSDGERLLVSFDKDGNLFGDNKCGNLNNIGKSADNLPAITPSKEAAKIISAVTATTWTRTDELNKDSTPTELQIRADYTITYSYREGSCKESGYWAVVDGWVRTESTDDKCDTRKGSQKGLKHISNLNLGNDGVLADSNSTLYVPTAKHNNKVSIFRLGTYTNAAVDVTVPAPLIASSAVKTTVKITNQSAKYGYNGSSETMKVKSFSVSSKPGGDGIVASKRAFNNVTIENNQTYEFDTTIDTASVNADGKLYVNVDLVGIDKNGKENNWNFYKLVELAKK